MKHIRKAIRFVENGCVVFRSAARGQLIIKSDEVLEIEQEIFNRLSNFQEDKKNLHSDRKKIGRDTRKCYNNIVLSNG